MQKNKRITLENGVTLSYREYGRGERYLLSTQNFFFEHCHEALLGQEPYHYHVFLITMRGYGESDHIYNAEPKNYTSIWGEDVAAFARAMKIPSFYYTGVSHGNLAGWYLAFHHPELIRAFVCCDGVAKFQRHCDTHHSTTEKTDWDSIVGNREALTRMAWMENWPTHNPERLVRRRHNEEEHLEILIQRKKEEFLIQNTDMSCGGGETVEQFRASLSSIPFPVLLWEGALDPLATPEEALALCHLIPGAQLIAYQHLGHGGADECPEITARDCDRFFRDTENRIL